MQRLYGARASKAAQHQIIVRYCQLRGKLGCAGMDIGLPSDSGEDVSPWLLIAWLLVRVGAILIPAVLAYRLLAHFREAQQREEQRQQLHAAVLWVNSSLLFQHLTTTSQQLVELCRLFRS